MSHYRDQFVPFFGVNAQIHIENAAITQINGTLDERVDIDERILENTGNFHNIRFREKTLEYTTSDRRENRGSKGRNSSTEPPGTSASENSGSGADESEDEGEGPPRVPSEAVTRAPYQQPTLPFAPPRKYQSEQSNREANFLALVNASAAMDMQAQREQRASNRGAPLPSALMSLGTNIRLD
ncbi:hypothetical protein BJ165DRAFT_1450626 [Panaeolus papilionaceus]|nr:hypothetical protein BJ165DRAFT_1450626 [Panaeolus papilionaceus]